jgi:rhomboid protease GluP
VIAVVTSLEFYRVGMGMPVAEMLARAALVKPAVRAGEWWRLLTGTYLHGDLMHIGANASALFVLGRLVETYEGRLRVPLAYLSGALAGSILSTLLTSTTSLGASGGVLGLVGYLFVAAGRGGPGATPDWLRRDLKALLASTAFIGVAAFAFIDNAAHLGGLAGGALAALAVGRAGPERARTMDAVGVAAAVVVIAGAAFTIARL